LYQQEDQPCLLCHYENVQLPSLLPETQQIVNRAEEYPQEEKISTHSAGQLCEELKM
jgi:hypothetical protein